MQISRHIVFRQMEGMTTQMQNRL